MSQRDLLSGLIRLHVLHHAAHKSVFGLGLIEELAHHGYKLSPGTLYPLLHGMERDGFLVSHTERAGSHRRRVYTITTAGQAILRDAKEKVRELFHELFEDEGHRHRNKRHDL